MLSKLNNVTSSVISSGRRSWLIYPTDLVGFRARNLLTKLVRIGDLNMRSTTIRVSNEEKKMLDRVAEQQTSIEMPYGAVVGLLAERALEGEQ